MFNLIANLLDNAVAFTIIFILCLLTIFWLSNFIGTIIVIGLAFYGAKLLKNKYLSKDDL